MHIKELVLDNFKSFGRKTRIPLYEDFTTISGPNGSGKSNIIDSVLFALGLAALVSFFAPFVGVPDLAWHSAVLPTVAAPTERSDQFVDVAPLILGVVAASVAVWLR